MLKINSQKLERSPSNSIKKLHRKKVSLEFLSKKLKLRAKVSRGRIEIIINSKAINDYDH